MSESRHITALDECMAENNMNYGEVIDALLHHPDFERDFERFRHDPEIAASRRKLIQVKDHFLRISF